MNGRPELSTRTTATVELIEDFAPDGTPTFVVVMKQRYGVSAQGVVWPLPGAEILKVDVPWDPDAALSSVRFPSDLAYEKRATDVMVVGEAVARDEAPSRSLDVVVSVGELSHVVTVTGTRVWYEGAVGLALTPPEPFTRVPLRWELAWGGSDPISGRVDPRNPYGRGVAADSRALVHQPGPQIEDPRSPIHSASAHNLPAGVAPVSPASSWRLAFAGTMDGRWQRERMPLRPLDFDPRFFQQSAPGLTNEGHLHGGERVRLGNLSVTGPIEFDLPRASFAVFSRTDNTRAEHRAALDTVLLRPTEGLCELTWRARVAVPPRPDRLRAVQVYEREVIA